MRDLYLIWKYMYTLNNSIGFGIAYFLIITSLSFTVSGIIGSIISLIHSKSEEMKGLRKNAVIGLLCCFCGFIVSLIPYIGFLGLILVIIGFIFTIKGIKLDTNKRFIFLYFIIPVVIFFIVGVIPIGFILICFGFLLSR